MAPIPLSSKKLTTALGDDGLDDYDQANLASLEEDGYEDEESEEGEDSEDGEEPSEDFGSEEEDEEVSEVDEVEEGGSGSGPQGVASEEGQFSGDEDGLALDELEDVELHPDVVPRRGVKVIDNKVCAA